uniref:very-long-chain (3R)-3-hydroxyacyl-CoA dehydratase n=1 Tax=Chrysotila carterae TaxID=13221 RepID=A0A7S4EVZ9_CHRCT|mmetsp:Transcript_21392/g.41702  ORF Transcript_21392/g.41702 Transcript_21392/m.41702 type:complete len:219 (+) Transcript_21392:183-839(+)|eukprot:6173501-Pleurochrysis_carterae.AAC.1
MMSSEQVKSIVKDVHQSGVMGDNPMLILQPILNLIAFVAWIVLLVQMLSLGKNPRDITVFMLTLGCECICLLEVMQICAGLIKGNVAFALVLHYTRMLLLLGVLIKPHIAASEAGHAIIYAWAITEVCRYPYYMSPNSSICRKLRYIVPLITFPIGAVAEAYCAYLAFPLIKHRLLKSMVGMVVPTNLIGGAFVYANIAGKAQSALSPKPASAGIKTD